MELYWWFLIPAILIAIFSDKIDSAVKADKKVRKVILVVCAGLVFIVLIGVIVKLLGR